MLVIRMQRTGRSGHAQFRVVVQDSRRTPTSGKVVAHLGHFNPHTKEATVNKEKAQFYLDNGAQPSSRVVRLLKSEGVKLPKWVQLSAGDKQSAIKNVEKLRRNRPAETVADADEPVEPETSEEQPATGEAEEPAVTEEAPKKEETPAEAPAEASEAPSEEKPEETT